MTELVAPRPSTTRVAGPSPSSICAPPQLQRIREITELLDTVAGLDRNQGVTIHDRRWQRCEFTQPLVVQPLDSSVEPEGEPWFVEGRDLSLGGLSFHHVEPLPHRLVLVTFPFVELERSLVAELSWCRFTQEGTYCSGGRFVRARQRITG